MAFSSTGPFAQEIISINGAQANGRPIYLGGQLSTFQFVGPAALGRIELSNDRVTWTASLTGLANGAQGGIALRCLWMRCCVANDGASAPRKFSFHIIPSLQK